MTSPLLNPVSGYSTFSRFVSFSCRPSIVTRLSVTIAYADFLLRGAAFLAAGFVLVAAASPSAGFEGGHEVDDLVRTDGLGRRDQLGLARRLALDEIEHTVAVGVLELLRREVAR